MSTPAYIARRNQGATNEQTLARLEGLERTPVKRTLLFIMKSDNVLTTGVKGDVQIHMNCAILSWTLLADVSGSIVVDVWKDTYANYPPTNADSITAGDEPFISGGVKNTAKIGETNGLWSVTMINAGDTLRFNIDSCSSITRCTIALQLVGAATMPLP